VPAKDQRLRHILDATLRVIATGGVDSVRYRAVAAEAGVPLGTLTYHFGSREELLRAALTHFVEENVVALRRLRDELRPRTCDDVARYMVELVRRDFADRERRIHAELELFVYAARDRQVAAALERWDRSITAELAQALDGLGVSTPFAAARTLSDAVRGFELTHLSRPDPDLDDFGQRLRALVSAFARPNGKKGSKR